MRSLLETILLLKKAPLFEKLRTDELRHVVPVLEPIGWVKGERVFELGDAGDEMFFITRGRIGISLLPGPVPSHLVCELQAGDYFGEMALLDDQPRAATIHVLETTEALKLGREQLNGLLLAYPELAIGMLRALSQRVRGMNSALVEAGQG
jgi:CRP-like cAMP-binding protein